MIIVVVCNVIRMGFDLLMAVAHANAKACRLNHRDIIALVSTGNHIPLVHSKQVSKLQSAHAFAGIQSNELQEVRGGEKIMEPCIQISLMLVTELLQTRRILIINGNHLVELFRFQVIYGCKQLVIIAGNSAIVTEFIRLTGD